LRSQLKGQQKRVGRAEKRAKSCTAALQDRNAPPELLVAERTRE
jgi:hypothetical protein